MDFVWNSMTMKKITIIFLLMYVSVFSQASIYVEYIATIEPIEGLFSNHATLKEAFRYAVENDDKLLFGLIVKNQDSKFFDLSAMSRNEINNFDSMALTFSGYTGMIYCIDDKIYTECHYLGVDFYSQSVPTENWNLTLETKIIDKYLCYKATSTRTILNGEKTFKHPIIAWYCPKLPYNNGPNGFGNCLA